MQKILMHNDQPVVYGNPRDGFHAMTDRTHSLCGELPPIDSACLSAAGDPTCEKCLELLKGNVDAKQIVKE